MTTRCQCQTCEGRRIEHPPVASGCECRECQPGPGIQPKASKLDAALGPVVKVQQLDYCVICQLIVRVTARRTGSGTGWVCVCENGHTWTSFD